MLLIPAALVAIAIGAVTLAVRVRRGPGRVAVLPLTVLLAAVAWWNVGYAGELLAAEQSTKLLWAQLQYPAIAAIPVAIFAFAVVYTGARWRLTCRRVAALAAPGAALALGAWTNGAHGLVWAETAVADDGSVVVLDLTHGPLFYVGFAWSYLLLLAAAMLLLGSAAHQPHPHHRQTLALLLAVVAPWVGNAVYVFALAPGPRLDYTNLGFSVGAVILALASVRFRLLHLAPVARHLVVEHLRDPMIVVDARGHVADCNRAAAAVLTTSPEQALGQPAHEVVRAWAELQGDTSRPVAFDAGEARRWYHAETTPVRDAGDRLAGQLVLLRDVTTFEHAQAELQRRAVRDPLTGLGNRELLDDRLAHAFDRGSRTAGSVAVLFIDLDGFKAVNDARGHAVGDEVLTVAARRLEGEVRGGDTLARIGGDEFVVVLEDVFDVDEVAALAERVVARLSEPIAAGELVELSASVGVAVASGPPASPQDLLREADQAMYAAKRNGRGRVEVSVLGSRSAPPGAAPAPTGPPSTAPDRPAGTPPEVR